MNEPGTILREKLLNLLQSFSGIYPELFLLFLFVALLILSVFPVHPRRNIFILGLLSAGLFLALRLLFREWGQTESRVLFGGMLRITDFSVFFRTLFTLAGFICILFFGLSPFRKKKPAEFYAVVILSILGLNLMIMSRHWLMLYLSAELVSIAGYILVAFQSGEKGSEAAMKYFIFGAVSSAFMLYGISLLYGLTGQLHLNEAFFLAFNTVDPVILVVVIFITLGGFLFKVSLVPFQFWVPDVYEGAPTPVAAYLSVAPKAGGLGVLAFILSGFVHYRVSALQPVCDILAVIAVLTLIAGNFSALRQTRGKRLLAYSSVAHSGFLLLGLIAFSSFGIISITFYLSVYLIMNFAAFLMVDMLSEQVGSDEVRKFEGLGVKLPLTGVIFVLTMVALAGLPPTAGFYAKFLVFSALWEAYRASGSQLLIFLLAFGVLNAIISLFYYLKIPYLMFFKSVQKEIVLKKDGIRQWLLVLLAFWMIWFFFRPDLLTNYLDSISNTFPDISL